MGDGWMNAAAALFTIAVIVHNGDHVRRSAASLDADVFWIGGLGGIALEVGLVVVIAQRHRLAPLATAVVGAGLAAAYMKVHVLRAHSWLSDSFTSEHVGALSWFAASLEIAAAVVVAAVGVLVLRRRGGLASASMRHGAQGGVRDAVAQPIVVVLIVSHALMLAAFFVQRFG